MDALDRKILAILATDSGLTAEQLGTRIGLSASATHRRVKLLEAAGDILGYRAVLSASARGNPNTVFVAVTLKDQRRETLAAFELAARRAPEVVEAHLVTGEFDYMLKLHIPAGHSYERVHREQLADMPGVQRLVTQFSISTIVE
jgi:DNA-binding Lrp family transcriptional regulator